MASDSRGFTRESGDYPVTLNEVIQSPRCTYQVLDILGRGTFGQVLKAWQRDTSLVVALKVLKNIPSYTKQGQLEIDVLSRLSSHAAHEFNIVQAYESFSYCGHICISFELLETNLYDYLKQDRFQPLALQHIRPIAQQVLCCLQRLREMGLVHSDIKPENIMLVDQSRWPFRVKVIDFGSATLVSTGNATSYLQSRYYRAPEVILSLPYTEAIDMWSLGCVLAELYLGWPLFPGANEYDQISYIISTLGNPPNNMFRNVRKACKFFTINRHSNPWTLKSPQQVKVESGIISKETRKYIFTSLSDLTRVSNHGNHTFVYQLDCLQFVSLLATMLTFDPNGRSSPSQALQSPFITMQHLATHTTDYSVREWIQCMHVCCLSRTTNSSPLTPHTLPSLLHPQHTSHMPAHSDILNTRSTLAPPRPSLPPTLPMLTYPPPHPLTYHLSPVTYLPPHGCPHRHKYATGHSSSETDTGYASADSSPITTRHTTEMVDTAQAHACFPSPHLFTPSQPSLPHLLSTPQHQLYTLYLAQQAAPPPILTQTHPHPPTLTQTHSLSHTLAPHTGSLHCLAPHTASLHTLAPHTASLHTLAPHTGSLHPLAPHTGSLHPLAPHTGSLHPLAPHTGSLHPLAPHTGSLHPLAPHTASLHTLAPHHPFSRL